MVKLVSADFPLFVNMEGDYSPCHYLVTVTSPVRFNHQGPKFALYCFLLRSVVSVGLLDKEEIRLVFLDDFTYPVDFFVEPLDVDREHS